MVGGGPAGAAAAIYAARKGIRTGLWQNALAPGARHDVDREPDFGPSYRRPQLARALETHVREYEVDIFNTQVATRLEEVAGFRVTLASGRCAERDFGDPVDGARWRKMGVPGEEQYLARGVTFCPHCDGPLFKGKRVAVIGGGNSGAEAAIDLAGLVTHVTLIEFDKALRADDVLQRKLRSLKNVTILTETRTTEVKGDGGRVTGLTCEDRRSGEIREIALEGSLCRSA